MWCDFDCWCDRSNTTVQTARSSLMPALAIDGGLSTFPSACRHRASFSVRLDGDEDRPTGIQFSFADGQAAVLAEHVPMMSEEIQVAMRQIEQQSAATVADQPMLWRLLSSVHFHSTSHGNLLVHMVYKKSAGTDRPVHRKGDGKTRVAPPSSPTDAWLPAARILRTAVRTALERELLRPALPAARRVDVVGHWKGHCVAADAACVDEEFALRDGRRLRFVQVGMAFSNPNADVAKASLECVPLTAYCRVPVKARRSALAVPWG